MAQLYQDKILVPPLTSGKCLQGRTLYRWARIDPSLINVLWNHEYKGYAEDQIYTKNINSILTDLLQIDTKAKEMLACKVNSKLY